ncbi:MAG: sortase, partial [bacterium]|nr:sortase [bacterium]
LGTTNLEKIFLPQFSSLSLGLMNQHQDFGISIPKLGLDEPVVFNVNPHDENSYREALKKGIAHASGSSFPDNPGLGYYFAHSSNPEFRNQYNAIFYLLGKLNQGDDVYIWHDGEPYHYLVTKQVITTPEDVSFFNDTYSNEMVVLQTCWPPGTTEKRLLVFAERVN